jgi:single-strand DNA-binding protein
MSFSINKVEFGGTVGADPELRDVNGRMVCEFPVAMNESWKGKDGQEQTHAEWVTVKIWDNDRVKHGTNSSKVLSKGSRVLVHGRRRTRSWEKDGVKQYKVECIANEVTWIDKKKDDDNSDPNSF